MKAYQIVSDLMHTRKINLAFMDVYTLCAWISSKMVCWIVHVITCCPLSWNVLDWSYINTDWLQIRKFLKKGLKVNGKLGMIKLEVSTIVAWNFDNKDCISAHPGVKVNWRHPVVRDLRLDWTFCQKDKLIVGELWFKGRFG